MSSEKVGHKCPPARTRFRAGISGNPSGRPRQRPSLGAALSAELAAAMPGTNPNRAGSKLGVQNLPVVRHQQRRLALLDIAHACKRDDATETAPAKATDRWMKVGAQVSSADLSPYRTAR